MKAQVTSFFDRITCTASFVVADPATRRAAIIDSVLDYDLIAARTDTASADKIMRFVEAEGLHVEWVLETHAHADHLSAAPYLKAQLGGRIAIGENITKVQTTFKEFYNLDDGFPVDGSQFDRLFADEERFSIGRLEARVLYTPGHTPACVSYVIGDAAFVGDTLFMPDYGTARCDFPGGDAAALYRSIQRLFTLPNETRVFVGHDYAPGGRDFAWETTIREQKSANVQVREGLSEAEFVARRTTRDAGLSPPDLILPAIQVNIRAGHLPEPDSNGNRYLKIPLNFL